MIDGDMTELQTAATSLHELFTAYTDAGFTEAQAMQIICQHVAVAGNSTNE